MLRAIDIRSVSYDQVLSKAEAVLASCQTADHLVVALRFMVLANQCIAKEKLGDTFDILDWIEAAQKRVIHGDQGMRREAECPVKIL